jgi:signal transduction histidine kinase
VVEAHRGQITAVAAAGGGAEFRISLPRTHMPAVPADEAGEL